MSFCPFIYLPYVYIPFKKEWKQKALLVPFPFTS